MRAHVTVLCVHVIRMMGVRAVHTQPVLRHFSFSFLGTRQDRMKNGIGISNQREVRREKAEWTGIRVKIG